MHQTKMLDLNWITIGSASPEYETSDVEEDYDSVLNVYTVGKASNNAHASPIMSKILACV